MSPTGKNDLSQGNDERVSALLSNANAVKAVASAVEGTLGPKGLDTMLVDETGEVVITNDGVTILRKMDVKHPAAKMVIHIAQAQQEEMGDGTTTATVLAAALLEEGVAHIRRGVPVAKVISGIRIGIEAAADWIRERSVQLAGLDDPIAYHIARVAGREHDDIARLILEGAQAIGPEKLRENGYKLSDAIVAGEGMSNAVISGVLISKMPLSDAMPRRVEQAKILVIDDAFAPEEIDDEALGTEFGFKRFLELKDAFRRNLQKLADLGVNVVVVDRSTDMLAEEFCNDAGILVLHRVAKKEMRLLMEHTGARGIKRTGLSKPPEELARFLGTARSVEVDERMRNVRFLEGNGKPTATILVGASTGEVAGERERIAKDAASSLQAAVRGGYVSGGGSMELAASRVLEDERRKAKGLEAFGVAAVQEALLKPLAQMVQNAGFNPLEKVEEVKSKQAETGLHSFGVDMETGAIVNILELGILDPAPVKIHALKAAGEVSEAILRIHTVIRMKREGMEEDE